MNYHQRQYELAYGRKRFLMPRYWLMSFLSAKDETQGAFFAVAIFIIIMAVGIAMLPEAIDKEESYHQQRYERSINDSR